MKKIPLTDKLAGGLVCISEGEVETYVPIKYTQEGELGVYLTISTHYDDLEIYVAKAINGCPGVRKAYRLYYKKLRRK